jgi:hypothetical protein
MSLQPLAGIQWDIMWTINTKKKCAYRRLVSVRPFNRELWSLICYAVCMLRAIIISVLFICNYWQEFNKTLLEPSIPRRDAHIIALFRSDPSTQSYGPWLVMQYTYRAMIVSVLFLCNVWLKFKKTLWKQSIPIGDKHIVILFLSEPSAQSYGPWLVMQYAYGAIIVSALILCIYWQEFNKL